MRILILFFCVVVTNLLSSEKEFEGEMIYYHNMKMKSENYSESSKYYDTLKITFKNRNYIKQTNKSRYERVLFIDSLKKRYIIYRDNLSKSKNLSMDEDNLNFGKLYNRENSHFGNIVSVSKSDTIFNLNGKDYQLKKLFVERQYGNETYVYSEFNNMKLTDNRNILRNIGEQIHPKEIASEINNSILYYYKIKVKNIDLYEEYRLVEIRNKQIESKTFKVPEYKDAKGFKKENKKNGRFKHYELTKQKH